MTLEVYALDGSLLRVISEPVDLTGITAASWRDFTLLGENPALQIIPGEFVAVHFYSEIEEDYALYPVFEILVQ